MTTIGATVQIGPIAERKASDLLYFVTDSGQERLTYNKPGVGWIDMLGSAAMLNAGSASGNIPIIPVPMSQMSDGIKGTMDSIRANSDSAAYHPASDFASASGLASANSAITSTQASVGALGATVEGHSVSLLTKANASAISNVVNIRERKFYIAKSLVNMNALGQDIAVWTGLPAQWRLDSLEVARPSASLLTIVKVGLFTGAGATGSTLLASSLVACGLGLNAAMTITAGVKSATQTAGTIYLNNTVALGLPATAFWLLGITDLSD